MPHDEKPLKISRIIIVVLVLVVVGVVALAYYEAQINTTTAIPKAWFPDAGYPLQLNGAFGVAGQQCVNGTGYIYCIGGEDVNQGPRSEVYSAPISLSAPNITTWTASPNPYPRSIHGQSCVTYTGFVYCVGGTFDDGGDDVSSSYYAPINGSVIGAWSSTTAYPIPIDSQSCVANSGVIACVGGNNETDGTNADSAETGSVWYAPLSATGIGKWSLSQAYPGKIYYPTCLASDGYIYCLGGADSSNNAVSTDYYATISSAGIGTWTQTKAYPAQLSGQACAIWSSTIYCVGGEGSPNSYTNAAYYSTVSSSGIGSWVKAADYPLSVGTTCVTSSGYLYCIGGFVSSSSSATSSDYHASLRALSGASTSPA